MDEGLGLVPVVERGVLTGAVTLSLLFGLRQDGDASNDQVDVQPWSCTDTSAERPAAGRSQTTGAVPGLPRPHARCSTEIRRSAEVGARYARACCPWPWKSPRSWPVVGPRWWPVR